MGRSPDASRFRGQFPIFRNRCQVRFLTIGIAFASEIQKYTPMLDVRMIERGLEKPGKTKGGLAIAMGVRPGAVSEILAEIRLIKASEIQPIIDYLELNTVPIMGRVGAGAVIEPEHEQVPPEGLGEIELPFPIAEETIAFEVGKGSSISPRPSGGT